MCGIFGIITPKLSKFAARDFYVLGVCNDLRGGDSCGVFIDKEYEYGVGKNKLFYDFFQESKVLKKVSKCKIALGHCRKASVGAINASTAQPVVIKNSKGEVQFVLMHNGTIVNYKELARKYIPDIDIKEMTDSQVMAQLFFHEGYHVLKEYIGAGAFVMVDYRNEEPEILFFKGESKYTQHAKVISVERPLYCSYNNNELIFSSIKEYLKALRPDRAVLTFQSNKLIKLGSNGKLYTIAEYDRSELWQLESHYSNNQVPAYGTVYNIWGNSSKAFVREGELYNIPWEEFVDMGADGIYTIGTRKAHGNFLVTSEGIIKKTPSSRTYKVSFWQGVLLKNPSCFEFLCKFAKEMKCSPEELVTEMPDLVHFLSPCICWRSTNGTWVTSDTPSSRMLYTGTATFPFTNEEVYFAKGRLSNYMSEDVPYSKSIIDLQMSYDYKIDSNAIQSLL